MDTNTLTSAWVDLLTSAGMGFIGILLITIPQLILGLSDNLNKRIESQPSDEDTDSTL